MKIIILERKKINDVDEFVRFWSELYSYKNEPLYANNIASKKFRKNEVRDLFVWKNGMKLSHLKEKSLESKILNKIDKINDFKTVEDFDLNKFRVYFDNVSSVWKIFLLHIINPNKFPIYDQHVHRAYNYLKEENWQGVSSKISPKIKESFYFNEYLSFILDNGIKDLKKFDEAMFSFGQFLNTNYNFKLLK